MGEQKKLEPDSEYSALDLDNDGVVSDKELAVMEALEKKDKMVVNGLLKMVLNKILLN